LKSDKTAKPEGKSAGVALKGLKVETFAYQKTKKKINLKV